MEDLKFSKAMHYTTLRFFIWLKIIVYYKYQLKSE